MVVRTRTPDTSESEAGPVERKLRLFLARFSPLLTSVHITLSGTSESDSCRCRVHIRLRDGESRTVDESASSLGEAADRVIWRLDHHLLRRSKANTARLDVARMPTRTLDRRSR